MISYRVLGTFYSALGRKASIKASRAFLWLMVGLIAGGAIVIWLGL